MFDAPEAPLSTTIPLVPPASCSDPLGVALLETVPLFIAVVKLMMQAFPILGFGQELLVN